MFRICEDKNIFALLPVGACVVWGGCRGRLPDCASAGLAPSLWGPFGYWIERSQASAVWHWSLGARTGQVVGPRGGGIGKVGAQMFLLLPRWWWVLVKMVRTLNCRRWLVASGCLTVAEKCRRWVAFPWRIGVSLSTLRTISNKSSFLFMLIVCQADPRLNMSKSL